MATASSRERIRVLIVNCYLDETRRLAGRPHFVPQGVGPAYLAGVFEPALAELRLYSEFHSGPLQDRALLGWPDLLVLTGMTSAYDRMRHVAAYARSLRPDVVVVAGGPGIRALPDYSRQFFDYCCVGDVEALGDVVTEVFGRRYVAGSVEPRFDLIDWAGFIGYVESSRNCNFKCSFCTLTGERNSYQVYDLDHVRRQIAAVGWRTCLLFIDNNFYGNNRAYFLAKLQMLRELWKQRAFGGWAALVTQDFFARDENLVLARESGCMALFSGVESFDGEVLRRFGKHQNLLLPQVQTIRKCLDAGIVFQYGVIFDVSTRSLADIRDEIGFITGTPEITLPAFMNLTIPILRTPYFYECLDEGRFLPNTKLRDMDGNTLVLRPRDPIPEVVRFLEDMPMLRGYRRRVARHLVGFYRRYRRRLSLPQMISAVGNGALLCLPAIAHHHGALFRRSHDGARRTYVTTNEPVGPLYTPFFPVDRRYERYFQPTMITDGDGGLAPEVAADLLGPQRSPKHGDPVASGTPGLG